MSGNAMEEGLLLQIHNPSHSDPSRLGFLAGALTGAAALFTLTIILPDLPRLVTVYAAIAVAAGIGTLVTTRIVSARTRYDADQLNQKRDFQELETQRKIREMNAPAHRSIPVHRADRIA